MTPKGGMRALASGVLLLVAMIFLYPLVWMLLGAFKTNPEIFDTGALLPSDWSWRFFQALFSGEFFNFWRALSNSVLLAVMQSIGATLFAAAAGYVIGTKRFRGRSLLRAAGIAAILLPAQALALPMFVWMNRIGLFDSLFGLAAVGMANGIGLLYFERVFRQVPVELLEAARMEGASEAGIFRRLLPLVRPHMIAFGFVVFALSWQADLLSTLLLHSDEKFTLIMWLGTQFGSGLRPPIGALMAGSSLALLVIGAVFAIAFPFLRSALSEFLR